MRSGVGMSTVFHATYWAHSLLLAHPRDQVASLTRSLGNARVDLNPHQIDAALFALRSPYSRGVLLADEVGLGKTIEAALVLAQKWAERRRRLLLIVPATLRKQWQLELQTKFFLPSVILESKTWTDRKRQGRANPFETEDSPTVVICSYQFAFAKREELAAIHWDLVVIDEAHRLRNVYKGAKAKTAVAIAEAIAPAHKLLLTATPLQNSLLELHGMVSILDPAIFGDVDQFRDQFVGDGVFGSREFRDEALRERIRPVCKRTLRRDVAGFVKFTNRHAITATFRNTATEQQLYDEVSSFLQREELFVLPSGQRPLLTLVLRKLLASSTRAIAATLGKFVERIVGADLTDDYEVEDDPASDDPAREVADTDSATSVSSTAAATDATAVSGELDDLRRFITLAESVARDSKAERLLAALPEAFARSQERGAARKAVIFTESRKTQSYLAELLAEHGYRGQIVLMNGTNTDPISKATYEEWKRRHQARWSEVTSGSKTADMKAAIVEEFQSDRSTLLIATESAAEGVNLQFCSIVINYDLPWNPQRIEQRIGRCHRYGQESDVLVVNFLNTSNQADVRVFELLEKKLQLFEGVFGTSDSVLGAMAADLDLERAIAEIYQRCRTTDEINRAFDALQTELDEVLHAGRSDARRALLDNFDADIHERLAVHRDEAKAALDEQQRRLLDLVRFAWGARATFVAGEARFSLTEGATQRMFNLDWRDANDKDEEFFRTDHLLALELLDETARVELPAQEVTFIYASHASALASHVGTSGWLELSRLSTTAVERTEEFLVTAACTDDGRALLPEVASRLFSFEGRTTPTAEGLDTPPDALATQRGIQVASRLAEVGRRSQQYLDEEAEKIERRTQDLKYAVERALKDLDRDVAAAQKAVRTAGPLEQMVAAKEAFVALRRRRDEARRSQYDEIERLEQQQEDLTTQMLRAASERQITEKTIATLRWHLAAPTGS